jgi:hypothetical protein
MLSFKITMAVFGALLAALAFIPGRRALPACFLRGIGMQALLAIPVGIAQVVWVMQGVDFPDLLTAPLAGVPFNVGGLVSAAAFESIDRAGLVSGRQTTVISSLHIYLPLVAAQAGVVAGIIAARTRQTGRILADRVVLIALGVALANSILGITWPWWGS